MVLLIEFFSIIISDCVHIFRAALSAFPGHIIASEGSQGMAFRIVNPDLRRQQFCDLCTSQIRMDIINLVSDRPHNHTWMNPVPANPGSNILPVPGLEKPGVIIFCLRSFPHIKRFVNNEDAHLIAQVKEPRRGRIMTRADGIHTHCLHQVQLTSRRLFVKRGAKSTQIVMKTYAFQFHSMSV